MWKNYVRLKDLPSSKQMPYAHNPVLSIIVINLPVFILFLLHEDIYLSSERLDIQFSGRIFCASVGTFFPWILKYHNLKLENEWAKIWESLIKWNSEKYLSHFYLPGILGYGRIASCIAYQFITSISSRTINSQATVSTSWPHHSVLNEIHYYTEP